SAKSESNLTLIPENAQKWPILCLSSLLLLTWVPISICWGETVRPTREGCRAAVLRAKGAIVKHPFTGEVVEVTTIDVPYPPGIVDAGASVMSSHETMEGTVSCLLSRPDMNLLNIRFFRGENDI